MRDVLSLSLSVKIRLLIRIYDRRLSAWANQAFDQADKWRGDLSRPRWPFGEKLTIQLIQIVMMAIIAVGLMVAINLAPR